MKKWQKINKIEAKELLDKALFKTFFHEIEWHEFLEKQFKWLKFEYYLYRNEALLPLGRIKTCLPAGRLISLPFCEYGGPLPLKKEINFEEFEKDILNEFNNIKIRFHPQILLMEEVEPPTGGSTSSISTHWIEDLDKITSEELWESLRKTLRHEIKHAQESGIEIKKSANQKELKHFYNLYVANLRRKKTVPYPWRVIQFLCQNSSSELLLAFYKGRIIGGDLFLNYNSFVHYFLSATDYKYRNFSASHLLLWEKIKSLIGKDIILDLGASPRGSALEVFKRGWRGTEYPIYQICLPAGRQGIKREDEFLRSSKLIRNIFGLMPSFLIKKLSPYLIKYRL